MLFPMWKFINALFCTTCISYAASLSSDDDFFFSNDLDDGDIQYASLSGLEGDPELKSYEDSGTLFSSSEDFGSFFPIGQNGDGAIFSNDDPTSGPLFIEDAPFLTAFDDNSALALDELPLPSFSEEFETPASNEFFETSQFDSELLSDSNCISDEEQAVSKSKREDVCTVEDQSKTSYPPPFANPERFNWLPENEPKRRPSIQAKNSPADLINCPSGPGGYRMYLICDTGKESDRKYTSDRGVTLYNLNTNRICMLLFLPRTCVQWADSQKNSFCL